MSDASISLKPVNDLLREAFFVPSYQRGFRWTNQQVVDLLNDIWEFQSTCENKEHFYCLQPIVVKRRKDGTWELVDGQQRLTTILLILACRPDLVDALGKPRFSLEFETRPKSGKFLKELNADQQNENIDYFHIYQAFKTIEQWFAARDGSQYLQLLACLTNDNETGKNVKVIWYELPEIADPVDAFTRLNIGKIPLTNSELIRALFLRSRNFGGNSKDIHQLKIAQEWDAIENSLQSDEMWYFLTTGAASPASRIEFIFRQIAGDHESLRSDDPTIQSALAMLESIHDKFGDSDGFYFKLAQAEAPYITFQLLDLDNFGLSDDLYIKMNARGKALTDFETFRVRATRKAA